MSLRHLLLLGLALPLVACQSEDKSAVRVSQAALAFNAYGGEKTVYVVSTESEWIADFEATTDGFSATKTDDGKGITVTAAENNSGVVRTATIIVTSGSATTLIELAQTYIDAAESQVALTPSQTEYELSQAGGNIVIVVSGADEWTAVSAESWGEVAIDKGGSAFTFSAGQNDTGAPRTTKVSVTTPGGTEELAFINVTQSEIGDETYNALLGEWDIYCDKWMTGMQRVKVNIAEPGAAENWVQKINYTEVDGDATHLSLLLVPGSSKDKILAKNLYMNQSSVEVSYDADERTISIPTGMQIMPDNVASFYQGLSSNNYLLFFDLVSMTPKQGGFYGEISEDNSTVNITTIENDMQNMVWGLMKRDPLIELTFGDMFQFYDGSYYPASPNIRFEKVD